MNVEVEFSFGIPFVHILSSMSSAFRKVKMDFFFQNFIYDLIHACAHHDCDKLFKYIFDSISSCFGICSIPSFLRIALDPLCASCNRFVCRMYPIIEIGMEFIVIEYILIERRDWNVDKGIV